MAGPRNGATMANGAMVRTNDSATRPRAALGEMLKNNEPASAKVTRVSPAVEIKCTVARRLNGEDAMVVCRAGDRDGFGRGRPPVVSVTTSIVRGYSMGSPPFF